jgi:branched-subunit amino acid aminotransferase/4-amino-4-deoxychorismate lyase
MYYDLNMSENYKTPAFLYGESIFTTCRVESGSVIDLERHINKLIDDAKSYYFLASTESIRKKVNQVIPKLEASGALRITISAPKRDGLIGKFAGKEMIVTTSFRELNLSVHKPVRLKLAKRVQDEKLCDFKIGSYGKELYLKRLAINAGFDDVLFYGEGKVFETSTSNIFFRKGDSLFTPKSGIYKGLTRAKIIDSGNIIEKDISLVDIQNNEFDEIFLCNSIYERIVVEDIG